MPLKSLSLSGTKHKTEIILKFYIERKVTAESKIMEWWNSQKTVQMSGSHSAHQ